MFLLSFGLFTFFCVVNLNIQCVTCACEKSFAVICNSLRDVEYNKTKKSWTELLVDAGKYEDQTPEHILSRRQLSRDLMDKLKWMIINRQVKKIERGAFAYCKFLDILILYGNDIETIHKSTFVGFWHLAKLGLENNNIRSIEKNAFVASTINSLDLSHNHLTLLIEGSFKNCKVNTLTVTHNRLLKIYGNSLPDTLKFLNLDHNSLDSISGLNNLTKLQELTLSHNGLSLIDISDLGHFRELKKLDLSFNQLTSVYQIFDNLAHLEYLDLSSNRLQKFDFTPELLKNMKNQFAILLANNFLRNLKLDKINTTKVLTTLSGNPWDCECAQEMQKVINDPSNTIQRTKCDQRIFSSGQNPYCVDDGDRKCAENKISELVIKKFKRGCDNLDCDLFNEIGTFFVN